MAIPGNGGGGKGARAGGGGGGGGASSPSLLSQATAARAAKGTVLDRAKPLADRLAKQLNAAVKQVKAAKKVEAKAAKVAKRSIKDLDETRARMAASDTRKAVRLRQRLTSRLDRVLGAAASG